MKKTKLMVWILLCGIFIAGCSKSKSIMTKNEEGSSTRPPQNEAQTKNEENGISLPQNEAQTNDNIEEPEVLTEKDNNEDLKPNPETDNLLMSLNWELTDEKIKNYKDKYLFDNEYITIGECLEDESDFVSWKYSKKENFEYLFADYFSNGNVFKVVFEFEPEKEVNIIELYLNDEKQDMDGIYEYYDYTFSWRENVASFGDSYVEDTIDYDYEYDYEYDEYEVSDIDVFSFTNDVKHDTAYYSEDSGLWLVGNTKTNGKPFEIDGIEHLYIEDGYLYFMGRIRNTSSKDFSVDLNVTIRSKSGSLLNDYVYSYNYVFTYDKSIELTRGEAPGLVLEGKGLTIEYNLPAYDVGYFTVAGARNRYLEDAYIDDYTSIRSWNVEPYYIYVQVVDYSEY